MNLNFLKLTEAWHKKKPNLPKDLFQTLHFYNFTLWHIEDKARNRNLPDSEIAKIKRQIDKFNQKRNDTIEKINEFYFKKLKKYINMNAPLHSEPIGFIIDRLSILNLKIFHMDEQKKRKDVSIAHIKEATEKLKVLQEQEKDLKSALNQLIIEVKKGLRQIKLYYQFKMYNDPKFNPEIYKSKKSNLKK